MRSFVVYSPPAANPFDCILCWSSCTITDWMCLVLEWIKWLWLSLEIFFTLFIDFDSNSLMAIHQFTRNLTLLNSCEESSLFWIVIWKKFAILSINLNKYSIGKEIKSICVELFIIANYFVEIFCLFKKILTKKFFDDFRTRGSK